MSKPVSPYHKPGFYAEALAKGRHRDIVGGRWDETGRVQMALLLDAGLQPQHHLIDIGAGSLRLGCKAVPYLDPGHYWATDLSGDLLRRGYDLELGDKSRLPPDHLIEDADFAFPGLPDHITHAIAFAVFTHLPLAHLTHGLGRIKACLPALQTLLFTVFLAGDDHYDSALRQPDGVVTHPDRAPYHHREGEVRHAAFAAGFALRRTPARLPRGQVLFHAWPRPKN
jgi:hypothetical protein